MRAVKPATRIDLRIDARKKSIIHRAATLLGMNITQFVMERVLPDAERIVAEDSKTKLSKQEWKRFCQRLDEPARDLPELRRLMREPSIFIKG